MSLRKPQEEKDTITLGVLSTYNWTDSSKHNRICSILPIYIQTKNTTIFATHNH